MQKTNSYLTRYTDKLHKALHTVSVVEFEKAIFFLTEAYRNRKEVFVCGNGGSAAIGDHFTCDHSKGIFTDTMFVPRVQNLGGSVATLTAIANDCGYDQVFSYNLRLKGNSNDVLVVVSSSGNSPNIIKAINQAKALNMTVIAMTGFDGGEARNLANIKLHVDSNNYGIVEDSHQAIMHALAQRIRIDNISIDINKQKL